MDLQDWDDVGHRFQPLLPVSGTGTGFGPLPSRARGILSVSLDLLYAPPFTSGLRIKSAMTVWDARVKRYSSALWILDQVRNDGVGRAKNRINNQSALHTLDILDKTSIMPKYMGTTSYIGNTMATSSSTESVLASVEEYARIAVDEASESLGSDVVLLDTSKVSDFTDYFVIVSGETDRHLEMMARRIEDKLKDKGIRRNHREGSGAGGWLLIDFPGFIVHLFKKEMREYYDLEELWSRATEVVRIQ